MARKYRIVKDDFAGFEAQVRICFIWWQLGCCNTSSTINRAKEVIERDKARRGLEVVWPKKK